MNRNIKFYRLGHHFPKSFLWNTSPTRCYRVQWSHKYHILCLLFAELKSTIEQQKKMFNCVESQCFPNVFGNNFLKLLTYLIKYTQTHFEKTWTIYIDALLKNSSHILRKDPYCCLEVISEVLTDEDFSYLFLEQGNFTYRHISMRFWQIKISNSLVLSKEISLVDISMISWFVNNCGHPVGRAKNTKRYF